MGCETPVCFLRLHECRLAAHVVVVPPLALHGFAAPEFQPDAFCQSVSRKPVQKFELRLPVQMCPRRLAYLLAQVGPRDEQFFDDLREPVAGLLVQPAALERILPQLVQVRRHTPDRVGVFKERDQPERGHVDVRMVPEHVLHAWPAVSC